MHYVDSPSSQLHIYLWKKSILIECSNLELRECNVLQKTEVNKKTKREVSVYMKITQYTSSLSMLEYDSYELTCLHWVYKFECTNKLYLVINLSSNIYIYIYDLKIYKQNKKKEKIPSLFVSIWWYQKPWVDLSKKELKKCKYIYSYTYKYILNLYVYVCVFV